MGLKNGEGELAGDWPVRTAGESEIEALPEPYIYIIYCRVYFTKYMKGAELTPTVMKLRQAARPMRSLGASAARGHWLKGGHACRQRSAFRFATLDCPFCYHDQLNVGQKSSKNYKDA